MLCCRCISRPPLPSCLILFLHSLLIHLMPTFSTPLLSPSFILSLSHSDWVHARFIRPFSPFSVGTCGTFLCPLGKTHVADALTKQCSMPNCTEGECCADGDFYRFFLFHFFMLKTCPILASRSSNQQPTTAEAKNIVQTASKAPNPMKRQIRKPGSRFTKFKT